MMRQATLITVLAMLCGCAWSNEPKQSPEEWQRNALSFLHQGVTTREQILMKLGEPTGRFENDRIFTYRIARKIPDEIRVVPRNTDVGAPSYAGVDYTLVLVFYGNTVQTHNLLPHISSLT
jgi:hypothetical protein